MREFLARSIKPFFVRKGVDRDHAKGFCISYMATSTERALRADVYFSK